MSHSKLSSNPEQSNLKDEIKMKGKGRKGDKGDREGKHEYFSDLEGKEGLSWRIGIVLI